jgi:hypothetical protein
LGHRNVKITNKGQATCDIIFGEGMPLKGRKILSELRTILETVHYTVKSLEYQYAEGLR